jgi:hypothetical protein
MGRDSRTGRGMRSKIDVEVVRVSKACMKNHQPLTTIKGQRPFVKLFSMRSDSGQTQSASAVTTSESGLSGMLTVILLASVSPHKENSVRLDHFWL